MQPRTHPFNFVTLIRVDGQLCNTTLFVRRLQLTGNILCPEKTRAEETDTNFQLQFAKIFQQREALNGSG